MTARTLRNRLLATAALFAMLGSASVPAHAVSKEIVQLQTQVQQLLDMVQRLQSTMDTKFAVMQNLAQQTADQASQMTQAVNALQQKLDAQAQAENGKSDAVSGQVQSLNDSVDELKTRIAKLDKSIQDLQAQLQQMQQQQQSQPNPATMPGTAPGAQAPGIANPPAGAAGAPTGDQSGAAMAPAPMAQKPPLEETYQAALRDFNAGRYQLAAGEFHDVMSNYPLDDLAGSSQFYLGEIAYQQKNYDEAVNDYNVVIESFSGNAKAPAAELHKGFALLALDKKESGIRELRLLIQRHPRTPEAARARSKLNSMGVKVTAAR